jgi:hypothetical protein
MNRYQANEIREHLIHELNINGFSDIVTELNTRLEEKYDDEEFERNPVYLLNFFLLESIDVLKGLSNRNFDEMIGKFNEYTSHSDRRIETITVQLIDQGEPLSYDLRNLPDYTVIINTIQDIYGEIQNENEREL